MMEKCEHRFIERSHPSEPWFCANRACGEPMTVIASSTFAAVEALPGEWEAQAADNVAKSDDGWGTPFVTSILNDCAAELRKALAGPEDKDDPAN